MSKDRRSASTDWWEQRLAEYTADGRRDAERGVFELPHPIDDNDPQDDDENAAYKEGFMQRRRELGDAFKWA